MLLKSKKILYLFVVVSIFCWLNACSDNNETHIDGDLDQAENEAVEAEVEKDELEQDSAEVDIENEEALEVEEETDLDISEVEEETEKEIEEEGAIKCNGFEELCLKSYSDIAYATTHNSMSNKEDGWIAYNQEYPMTKQLEDGIRAMMLDTYYYPESDSDGDNDIEAEQGTYLCHGDCYFGSKLLVDGLKDIADFLESHPYEVVTLIFESYISGESTREAFIDSGLIDYVYSHDATSDWPTLMEMIESGKRVVVFTDRDGGDYDWYMKIWDNCFDTAWHNVDKEDFDCEINRGESSNDLFILNHFLYGGLDLPSASKAEIANANPFFLQRVEQCQTEREKTPNFITVDFYSIGDLFEVVNSINKVKVK